MKVHAQIGIFFYVHEHIYEKNIQFLMRCSKKSIHCARNHKGKGEQQQDSDYFEDFEVNQFINLKL